MGTSNSQKKSIPDSEQKIEKAETLNQFAPFETMPESKQSIDCKQIQGQQNNQSELKFIEKQYQRPQVRYRMNAGLNGLDILKELEFNEKDINAVTQAVLSD